MSHSAENFRKGILLFLRKLLVSKSFMDERGVSRFSVENFWSHSAEKVRGHPFNASENLGYRKFFMHNTGYHVFPSKIFGITVPKHFVGELFSVSLISGIENFYASVGFVTIFCRIFLPLSAEKYFR